MSYNPTEYWTEQGKIYQRDFVYNEGFILQESILLDLLKSIKFYSVLEMGCGFGRITNMILLNCPVKKYVAVDLSPEQIQNARKYVNDKLVRFVVSDFQHLKVMENEMFDLVIASEVLMHVLPSEIENVMTRMVSLSNKHVVSIDWYEHNPPERVSPHNFCHQYEKIYSSLGCKVNPIQIKNDNIDTKQFIFHCLA